MSRVELRPAGPAFLAEADLAEFWCVLEQFAWLYIFVCQNEKKGKKEM